MSCGKNNNNLPLCEFILESPAPVDVAAKLSYILASYKVGITWIKFFLQNH